jgi:hypothetical protein
MKHIKLYEDFISESNDSLSVTPESKIEVDTYTTDGGLELKAVEITGIISSAKTEKEFKDYFYDTYGQGEFTKNDIETLCTYFNEFEEELVAAETEEEEEEKKEEEGAGDEDPLADI